MSSTSTTSGHVGGDTSLTAPCATTAAPCCCLCSLHCRNASKGYLWRFLVVVSSGIDAVFDAADPLPFLGLHFVQVGLVIQTATAFLSVSDPAAAQVLLKTLAVCSSQLSGSAAVAERVQLAHKNTPCQG